MLLRIHKAVIERAKEMECEVFCIDPQSKFIMHMWDWEKVVSPNRAYCSFSSSDISDVTYMICIKSKPFIKASLRFSLVGNLDEFQIHSFDVEEDFQGQGYGGLMLVALISLAIVNNISRIHLSDASQDGLIYQHLGFKGMPVPSSPYKEMSVWIKVEGRIKKVISPNVYFLKKVMGIQDDLPMSLVCCRPKLSTD